MKLESYAFLRIDVSAGRVLSSAVQFLISFSSGLARCYSLLKVQHRKGRRGTFYLLQERIREASSRCEGYS